jgi:hypothetical protein
MFFIYQKFWEFSFAAPGRRAGEKATKIMGRIEKMTGSLTSSGA